MPRVVIVALDGADELEVAGVHAAIGAAREERPDLEAHIVAVEALVTLSRGARLVPHQVGWGALAGADALVVVGGPDIPARAAKEPGLYAAIRAHLAQGGATRLLAATSTGAMVLARAGVLADRRAVTSRAHRDALAAEGVDVDRSGKRVMRDGRILTSAGPAAGVELGLAIVAALASPDVAERAADRLDVRGFVAGA